MTSKKDGRRSESTSQNRDVGHPAIWGRGRRDCERPKQIPFGNDKQKGKNRNKANAGVSPLRAFSPQPASSHPSEQVHWGPRSWPGTPIPCFGRDDGDLGDECG